MPFPLPSPSHSAVSNGTFSRFRALVLTTLLALTAGCAGISDARLVTQRHATQATEFKNAWGPVSERTRTRLLNDLKNKTGDLDILSRQVALEEDIAGTPLVLDNKVTVLLDGPQTYAAMFKAIREAKQTVNVEKYIIRDDEVGREFATLLLERAAAGVKVNVLYDSAGCITTPKEYFERLQQGGVQVLAFNPVNPLKARKRWKLNHRDHRKLTIVDGRTVFLGGINIDDVYATSSTGGTRRGSSGGSSFGGGSGSGRSSGGGGKDDAKSGGWRDTDVQIDGPVVADFQKMFLETWEKQKGPALRREDYLPQLTPKGKDMVRAIGSTPDDPFSATYLTFIAAITHAQKQVYITNAYFVPDEQLVDTLIGAAGRGVDVRLILPSVTDSRAAAYAAHSHYTRLLSGGVKIYERRAALLHAKTVVIDGVWSCVGSANLDWRSAVDNDEVAAVILSPQFAERMVQVFGQDQAQSDAIDLAQWQDRPWRQRAKEWFVRLFARLL